MTLSATHTSYIEHRQRLLEQTGDATLKKHYQAEIELVKSWDPGAIGDPQPSTARVDDGAIGSAAPVPAPVTRKQKLDGADGSAPRPVAAPPLKEKQALATPGPVDYGRVPHGYAPDWHTIRFSNTTNEPLTVQFAMGAENGSLFAFPGGADASGKVTIAPGEFADLEFAPGSHFNFKSTKGDGSVFNLGEFTFKESENTIYGDVSYIYGANSNLRIFSEDGKHSGYLGDITANAPPDAKVGDWGIVAPFDRFNESNDPNKPGSGAGGPGMPQNAGGTYLYSILEQGEGYVNRGRPVEISDYDDHSTLGFGGRVAVVF